MYKTITHWILRFSLIAAMLAVGNVFACDTIEQSEVKNTPVSATVSINPSQAPVLRYSNKAIAKLKVADDHGNNSDHLKCKCCDSCSCAVCMGCFGGCAPFALQATKASIIDIANAPERIVRQLINYVAPPIPSPYHPPKVMLIYHHV